MVKSSTTRTVLIGVGIGVLVLALILGFVGLYRWASSLWAEEPPPPPDALCRARVEGLTAEIDLEQSRNASIISGIATQRGLIPRAVSIALATAFQESGIRNLDYGDRDSLGIFQQRPSMGWGTPEQIMDPYYSSGKFFDEMVKIEDWQVADIGDVAQEVQRSGFPDAYDQHVDRARLLASALSGETPASWSCVVHDPKPSDPQQLLSELTRAYGSTMLAEQTPATTTEPAFITITASTEEVAWSTAAFAQSWASMTGVVTVSVGIYEWKASADTLAGWIGLPERTQPSTITVITF